MSKNETFTSCDKLGGRSRRFDGGRREALRKLGMASAALAAPMVLPARLLAQVTAKSDTPPPSERLNIGLVGLGSAMAGHLRAMLPMKEMFIRAVCDVDRRKVTPAHADVLRGYRKDIVEYGKCLATQDHRELVARDDIDGVVIATPVHWHAAIALDAIRSGKDVLCQSPMTLTVREGQMIEAAARQHGAILQVVTPLRTEGPLLYFSELVRNGYVGKVSEVYLKVGQFEEDEPLPVQPVPAELDYDRWLGPAPWAAYHSARIAGGRVSGWRRFWEYGLRKHGEVGFGLYDLIQLALGMEQTTPVEFVPQGAGDSPHAHYRYDKGPTVYLDRPSEGGQDIEIVGSQGSLAVSSRGQISSEPEAIARMKFGPADTRLPDIGAAEFSWLESMRSRKPPLVDAGVGRRSSLICQLNAIAEQVGRPITWDAAKREIAADPLASRLLDRPRRAPYGLI